VQPASPSAPSDPPRELPRTLRPAAARRARALRYTLPLAAAFVASVALGAVYIVSRGASPPPQELPHPAAPATPAPRGTAVSTPPPAPGAPAISVDDLPNAESPPDAPRSAAANDEPSSLRATAPELFRRANAARRAGDVRAAIDLYRALIARHSGTPEAHAARVSLGRLLLDREGDPAGALAEFDAYLASSSADRSLAEEARLGRALVFQREGRTEEERRAWQELLDRHPDSVQADRARARLQALAPPPEGGGEAAPRR
jgi:TolA-binding protein